MILAIVGSRSWPLGQKDRITKRAWDLYHLGLRDGYIVSGGARVRKGDAERYCSVDHVAEEVAKELNLPMVIYKPFNLKEQTGYGIFVRRLPDPTWQRWTDSVYKSYGQAAYARNAMIVSEASRVQAFWDGVSKGTKHAIDLAIRNKKELEIIYPGGVV